MQPAAGISAFQALPGHRRTWAPDAIAAGLLALLALWLFRGHFLGDTLWIGNPDRLNSDLKVLRHYLSGQGGIPAWDENEMMGYDSFVLPYTFPNPLVYVVALFGADTMYAAMGYVVIAMLAGAGIAAYAFLRSLMPPGLPVLIGAICYEFSSLTILKASQNSMSFAVFVVIPLLLLAIRHIRRENSAWCFMALATLVGTMLSLMFLQKAAYALMLAGAYAASRSWSGRSWRPLVIFALAVGVAVIFAYPRMLGIGLALAEYKRVIDGVDLKDFNALYGFQNIYPYEILRWFDGSIFGRGPSDSVAIGNNINLTEGFLLATSGIVPFLLAAGLVRSRFRWLNPTHSSGREEGFFFWMLALGLCVIVLRPVAHLMFLLFMKVDFTHARFQIAALLPLALLVAATLSDVAPPPKPGTNVWPQRLLGLALGVIALCVIEAIAGRFLRNLSYYDIFNALPQTSSPRIQAAIRLLSNTYTDLFTARPQAHIIRMEPLARIGLSAAAFLVLWKLAVDRRDAVRGVAFTALCAIVGGQCLLAANDSVNGPLAREFSRPFFKGDFYQARHEEFTPPSSEQLKALHRRVEPQKYRVALICDPRIADGFCAGHVPEFWQLRAIDGYYGLAVPRRLRALPWANGISLRTISFSDRETVPWELLGFLNVKYVLTGSDGVFRNIERDGDRILGRAVPEKFEIATSPARVTPRAFFASTVRPASSPEEAAQLLFRADGIVDPTKITYAEGFGTAHTFSEGGHVEVKGSGDSLELSFDASSAERFLVLNELYFPGWRAESAGQNLQILATNAVMRGLVVPAGAKSVRFNYTSHVDTTSGWVYRLAGMFALFCIFFFLSKRTNQR